MLNKIVDALSKLREAEGNPNYKKEIIADATEMFSAGWDKLDNGIVILTQGKLVAVKHGNTIVKKEMKDFNINMGKLDGNVAKEIGTIEVNDSNKDGYLAQAIITKYYTIRRA